jgi:endonuclease-3
VRDHLRRRYGRPSAPPHRCPLDELILTVLSQSTNDRNRDVAFQRLRERFPDWEAVRDAPLAEVEEAIRPGGISKVKSARIQAILADIGASSSPEDPLTLDWLAETPVEEARDFLCRLPGVGRKTAACVLLSRVATRLGLLRAGAPFPELHDAMLALTAPGEELELHLNLLRHGRRTCHARSPACAECVLARMCPSARRL